MAAADLEMEVNPTGQNAETGRPQLQPSRTKPSLLNALPLKGESKQHLLIKAGKSQPDRKTRHLPDSGIPVSWSDLELEVATEGEKSFKILKGVSGIARPGRVLAMMGPSGAGKTTLVECLAHRARPTAGKVSFNGRPWRESMSRRLAYCHQLDLFRSNLTVKEHLLINARLRMDSRATVEEIEERVEETIVRLGLTKCADTLIGAPGMGGISGGERKRLSIASEILNKPSIIFLDEPTSGLDSFMAANIMSMLKNISKGYSQDSPLVTIIAIIHQPSSELFRELEDLTMLADGKVAYSGEAKHLVEYSNSIDFKVPTFTNPAEFFMNLISINPEAMEESKATVEKVVARWKQSKDYDQLKVMVDEAQDSKRSQNIEPEIQQELSSAMQLKTLLWREVLDRRRNKLMAAALILRTIVFYLFLGSLFYQLGSDSDQKAVQSISGAIFFIMINQAFTYVIPTVQTFPREIAVFKREYSAGIYRMAPYYLSKCIANLPLDLIIGAMFTPIVFFMIDFSDDPNVFGGFVGILALLTLMATALGYWVSCMAPNDQIALQMGIVFVVIPIIPSGFIINLDEVPPWYVWLKESSPFTWGFRLLMTNQWANYGDIACSDDDKEENLCTDTQRQFDNGEEVLRFFGIDKDTDARNGIIVLCCLILAYHSFAIISLFLKTKATAGHLSK